jgi:pimeloyl-ACP methyl ester carboxylesterase
MTPVDQEAQVRPFRIQVPECDLLDLQQRLAQTRWPDELPGVEWSYGVPLQHVKDLVAYWQDGFDWRAQEAKVNAYPQFTTTIDGQNIHFLHVRSPQADALPLIVTHGWPMSVFEYIDLIGPLTDPVNHGGNASPAFHVVVPSVPGVAFSGPTTEPDWTTRRIARAWATLMDRLGYDRYGAHGNDGGSMVSPELGRFAPDNVVGVHVTQLFSFPSGDPSEFADLTPEDAAALQFLEDFAGGGGLAYNAYQSAQPQTLSYALQDSPTGWVAWVSQLFQNWTDRDYVLANASAYWLTGTIGSSIRRYYEDAHDADTPTEPTTAPTGVSVFAEDFQTIRKLADRDHANIVQFRRHDRGSHFAPRDASDLLLTDIRDFFGDLR